jgi:hypothetical protein
MLRVMGSLRVGSEWLMVVGRSDHLPLTPFGEGHHVSVRKTCVIALSVSRIGVAVEFIKRTNGAAVWLGEAVDRQCDCSPEEPRFG